MASRFALADYDSDSDSEHNRENPPLENRCAAADFIKLLCSAHKVPYVLMGGFAMNCRGSGRSTRDVDVVVNMTMKKLWAMIEPQPRMIIPDTKLLEGVVRTFVHTGPEQGDVGCTEDMDVEVDLVLPGAKGTPKGESLTDHQNLRYMMQTKLRHIYMRPSSKDSEDIVYMLHTYPDEILAFRDELNPHEIDCFLGRMKDVKEEKADPMETTPPKPSEGSDEDDDLSSEVHIITNEDMAEARKEWAQNPSTGPSVVISPLCDESVTGYPDDVSPRNRGIGEIRTVVDILEGANISCCLVAEAALIYYGAGRVMMDWTMCVPTEHLGTAAQLFRDKPEIFEPFRPSARRRVDGLARYYPRFRFVGLRLFFVMMPSQAHNIRCKPEDIEYSQMRLPFPKLPIYAQSLLVTRNFVDLDDLIDGMNLTLDWGIENLNLEGTIDAEWGRWKTDLQTGGHANERQVPMWCARPDERRATWESMVSDEAKKNRQGFKYVPIYETRFWKRGMKDPRLRQRDFI